ncbi:serine/threonine-protein kinase [Nocardioides lijunqiniae]|uniref:serine/threonine-protein kinase n=1 Tax=Nocardioides lijunqiniae TaxID=2760832 RepID=UPI001877F0F4|nr:serine/threonine-protein kinase [Nocardioides lijunqiniae]
MGTTEPPLAGRYVLLDPIGVGGMGSVWRAWDLRERRLVAAKLLGRYDDALLQRFVREQAVRVEHPHVVAPTGWAADGGRVVLTMDLVAGGSVADLRAEHGPLPEPVVARLLDQLLQALEAVHAAGLVHRDVKPANLLLEPGPLHLRLADFGVAAVLGEPRLTGAGTVGTRGYSAPEQDDGADPHPAQDLYAVGVVGRELTGRRPGVLDPLLGALCDPDPARRPASASEALVRLRRLPVPVTAAGVVVRDRLGPAAYPSGAGRRLTVVLAGVCLVCLALAIVLGVAVTLRAT